MSRRIGLQPDGEPDHADDGNGGDPPRTASCVPLVEEDADERGEHGDEHKDEPRVVGAEDERKVPDQHREQHREREVVVVHRSALCAEERRRIRLALLGHCLHELPVRRDDHEENVRDHDRSEHRSHLQVRRTWREQLSGTPRCQRDERGSDDDERNLASVSEGPAQHVVHEPSEHEAADAQRHGLPGGEVGDLWVSETNVGVEVVENDEESEPGEPGCVRLPFEPVQWLGHLGRREPVLLRVVEAAAVHAPELARDTGVRVLAFLRWSQREVEPDEVEGRADPRDPRDYVQHPEADVEDVSQVRVHRSLAIATSSRQPVSSSSSRVRPIRCLSTPRISDFGRLLTKTTKRNPNFPSYSAFRRASSCEHVRVGVIALLGGRTCREPCALTDRRMRVERLELLLLGQALDDLVGSAQRILDLRQELDQAGATLEQLGELVRGQLPR